MDISTRTQGGRDRRGPLLRLGLVLLLAALVVVLLYRLGLMNGWLGVGLIAVGFGLLVVVPRPEWRIPKEEDLRESLDAARAERAARLATKRQAATAAASRHPYS